MKEETKQKSIALSLVVVMFVLVIGVVVGGNLLVTSSQTIDAQENFEMQILGKADLTPSTSVYQVKIGNKYYTVVNSSNGVAITKY
tara:strand:+ start:633 stop:890 length:258 start_codon:yes stop_codon:yes gene_type:complete